MDSSFCITNFEDIHVGAQATLRKKFTVGDIDAFARLSGDFNPLHVDDEFISRTRFHRRVVHGILLAASVSSLVGMHLPGPGALWLEQNFEFLVPVLVDDEVEFQLQVQHKSEATRTIVIHVESKNQQGILVMKGQGKVMVLEEHKHPSSPSLSQESPFLKNRLALVTGASRGIGAAIASALGRASASIIVNYRASKEQAEDIANVICQGGGKAIPMHADVSDEAAVKEMVDLAEEVMGQPVDILINNASGSIGQKSFLDSEWDDVERHFNVQVKGAFNCCQAIVPKMIAQGSGQIINIGSIYSWGVPPENLSAYVLTKSALAALTRCLAVELGPKGIRTNMVSPGMTETDLISDVPERMRKVFAMQTPLRRLAAPEDVAGVVLTLCSPTGNFINGSDIPVCGGRVM